MSEVESKESGATDRGSQPGVTWEEWRQATLLSTLVAGIAFLPYAFAYLTVPEGKYYLGFLVNAKDQNTYFMWMTQVASGSILLQNLYTSIPHDGAMLNLFFLGFGLPARWFGWSLDSCYQIARILSSVALGLASYAFVAMLFPRGKERWTAWAAVLFTAGFGWLTSIWSFLHGTAGAQLAAEEMIKKPVDTWVPEAFGWYSLLIMPHFALAIACLLLTISWICRGLLGNRINWSILAGSGLFVLSFVHPYDVIVIYSIVFVTAVLITFRRGRDYWQVWRHVGALYLIATPPIVYNYFILNWNSGMRAWLIQNVSDSPGVGPYLLGFGIPLFVSMLWVVGFFRRREWWNSPWVLVCAWIVVAPFLAYSPVAFQRRLIIGLAVPLGAATAAWVFKVTDRFTWRPFTVNLFICLLLTFSSFTSLFHFANGFRKVLDRDGENYTSQAQVDLLRSIGSSDFEGTVLSSFETGNLIPRFSGRQVVIGSRGQTGDFDKVLSDVRRFFAGAMSHGESAKFLADHRVGLVYYGPEERRMDHESFLKTRLESLGWIERAVSEDGGIEVFCRPNGSPGARLNVEAAALPQRAADLDAVPPDRTNKATEREPVSPGQSRLTSTVQKAGWSTTSINR